jgi:multidrug transporter EmrE-like cation transporter
MSSAATAINAPETTRSHKPIYMVVCCTLFASAAQVLMKMGAVHTLPKLEPAHFGSILAFALLLIFALRHGELSILWPLYALSYVWVALLSVYFFGDHLNPWKLGGIALIVLGVALLGRASTRA